MGKSQKRFLVFAFIVAALAFSLALRAILVKTGFPVLSLTSAVIALVCAFISLRGRHLLAVRIMETLLAASVSLGAMTLGIEQPWASGLAYIPATVLLFLYFDGKRAFQLACAWAVGLIFVWVVFTESKMLSDTEFSIVAAGLVSSLVSIGLLEESLKISIKDKAELLGELQHRMGNGMQILLSLAPRRDGTPTPDQVCMYRAQIRAMGYVHTAISVGDDLYTLDMSKPLSAIAREAAVLSGLECAPSIEVRSTIKLPVEKALPTSLIALDILVLAVREAGGRGRIVLDTTISGGKVLMSISMYDSEGVPLPARPDLSFLSGILLQQIGARLERDSSQGSWALVFDSETAAPGRREPGIGIQVLWKKTKDSLAAFLVGKPSASRQSASERQIRLLAGWPAFMLLLLSLVSIFSAVSGDGPRYASLLVIAGALVAILLVRAGRSAWARTLVLSLLPVAYLLAVLTSPGRGSGVQMYFLPALILTFALLSGRPGGVFATLFGAVSFAAWYGFVPDRALPEGAVLDLVAGFFLFGVLVVLLIRDFDKDLQAKEVLLRELQYRLSDNLGLLDRLLLETVLDGKKGGDPRHWERFQDCVRGMAFTNRVVSSAPDAAAIEMGIALQDALSRFFAPGVPEGKKLAIQSVGTLPADKAIPVLLLVMEMFRSFADSADTFRVSFRRFFDHAELSVELRGSSGSIRKAPPAETPYTRMIERQIPAEVQWIESGRYRASFRV